jgi:acyl-CoA hydrolase/ribosomal protein S18 acetylase RimI-like enzyme
MEWRERYAAKQCTADEAVTKIPPGRAILIGSGAAEPVGLVEALGRQAARFADNTIVHLMTLGPAPYAAPEHAERFRHNAFFIGANVRGAVHEGRADYTPVFLSRIPGLIRSRRMPVDVVLLQCTPPDKFGYVNIGVSVDVMLAGIESARLVIAEINPNVPRVHGAGFLKMDRVDLWTWNEAPLLEHPRAALSEVELEIGRNVATLIEDGSTLQAGIGAIPDAVMLSLMGKRDLGVWTEMFSEGLIDLIEAGVVTGRYKTIHPGKITSSFAFGTRRLYDYLDRNPLFTFQPSDLVNDPIQIAQQHKMVAINSALEVDLTGQVCADSIGTRFYSGIGGQVDFIRGAAMSKGGKPIIALPSTAKNGALSRIVPTLTKGAGVVTSRGDVRYVATEYGVADLLGKSIRERALALISIAHPSFRAELLREAKAQHYVFVDQIEPRGRYPREIERRVTTKDGRELLLRPLRPTDEPKLTELFYSLSENSMYKRFQRVMKRVPHEERSYYLDVDYVDDMAVVIETCDPQLEPEIVAIAQYFVEPASGFADVGFIVRDAWQGQGLGRILVDEIVRLARARGAAGITADVLATNGAMLALFRRTGLEVKTELEDGVCRLTMPFGEPATVPPAARAEAGPSGRSG